MKAWRLARCSLSDAWFGSRGIYLQDYLEDPNSRLSFWAWRLVYPPIVWRIRSAWQGSRLALWYCGRFGCSMQFDSYEGPDGAGESWYCPRCDAGGHHTYF